MTHETERTFPPINEHPGMIIRTTIAVPEAEREVAVSLWHSGRRAQCTALIDGFIREVGVRPTSRTVDSGPFFDVEFDEYCAGFTPEQCVMAGRDPDGAIPRDGLATYSEITRHAWPADGVAALLDQVERHQISPVLEPPGVSDGLQTGKAIIGQSTRWLAAFRLIGLMLLFWPEWLSFG